jgi:hypothetical protein
VVDILLSKRNCLFDIDGLSFPWGLDRFSELGSDRVNTLNEALLLEIDMYGVELGVRECVLGRDFPGRPPRVVGTRHHEAAKHSVLRCDRISAMTYGSLCFDQMSDLLAASVSHWISVRVHDGSCSDDRWVEGDLLSFSVALWYHHPTDRSIVPNDR